MSDNDLGNQYGDAVICILPCGYTCNEIQQRLNHRPIGRIESDQRHIRIHGSPYTLHLCSIFLILCNMNGNHFISDLISIPESLNRTLCRIRNGHNYIIPADWILQIRQSFARWNHELIRHFRIMGMDLLKTDDHQWNQHENNPGAAEKLGGEQNQNNRPGYSGAEYIHGQSDFPEGTLLLPPMQRHAGLRNGKRNKNTYSIQSDQTVGTALKNND